MKTIMKLYPNGNLEIVNTPLQQLTAQDSPRYSFAESGITLPPIIEYPPVNVRNYFIEKTSVSGWVSGDDVDGVHPGEVIPPNEHDRTSDFISVSGWGNGVSRFRFLNMDAAYRAWVAILFYNASKEFVSARFDDWVGPVNSTGDYVFEHTFPANVAYIRIACNYYDHPTASVKISVEKGTLATKKHYLAFEDMPNWVKDTGHPISIFPQGVVIKGNIIQTNN